MKQITFFDADHEQDMAAKRSTTPFVRQSETSRQAAHRIADVAPTIKSQVLRFIESRGERGATDEEMQTTLQLDPSTQRPRRRELQLAGVIRNSGDFRKTKSGRLATVWITEVEHARMAETKRAQGEP